MLSGNHDYCNDFKEHTSRAWSPVVSAALQNGHTFFPHRCWNARAVARLTPSSRRWTTSPHWTRSVDRWWSCRLVGRACLPWILPSDMPQIVGWWLLSQRGTATRTLVRRAPPLRRLPSPWAPTIPKPNVQHSQILDRAWICMPQVPTSSPRPFQTTIHTISRVEHRWPHRLWRGWLPNSFSRTHGSRHPRSRICYSEERKRNGCMMCRRMIGGWRCLAGSMRHRVFWKRIKSAFT